MKINTSHVVTARNAAEPDQSDSYMLVAAADQFGEGDFVSVLLDKDLRELKEKAEQAVEAEKQREGAVRHLESTRAELVRVSAEHLKLLEREKAQANRRRLPEERNGVTHTFVIHAGGQRFKGFITVGLYDDGEVGEVFMKLDQQGSQISGFCDAWAIGVSMLLQTGTSLATICQKFKHMKFEPAGRTETPGIRSAESPIDYAARYLERRFVLKLPLADDGGSP